MRLAAESGALRFASAAFWQLPAGELTRCTVHAGASILWRGLFLAFAALLASERHSHARALRKATVPFLSVRDRWHVTQRPALTSPQVWPEAIRHRPDGQPVLRQSGQHLYQGLARLSNVATLFERSLERWPPQQQGSSAMGTRPAAPVLAQHAARSKRPQANRRFNADANSGHAFGIVLPAVCALGASRYGAG